MANQKVSEKDFAKVVSNISRLLLVIENLQRNQNALFARMKLMEQEVGKVGDGLEDFLEKATYKRSKKPLSYIG